MSMKDEQEQHDRYIARRSLRGLNKQVVELLEQWVSDGPPDYELFNAARHKGMYDEYPEHTLIYRLRHLGLTPQAIDDILAAGQDSPLNYMTSQELAIMCQCVADMIEFFQSIPSGTFTDAREIYQLFGEDARKVFYAQTGYYPEQSPIPDGKIHGRESAKRFPPPQPRLFSGEE